MTKTNQILSVALVLQVVLIAATTFGGSRESAVLKPTKVFDGFEPEKITKIKVNGDKGVNADAKAKSVTLEKTGTTWGVAEADHYPVDGTKVDTFLKNVAKLTARGAVVTKKAYFPKLEVADEKFQRMVMVTQDGKEQSFYLGSSPSFKKIHLRKAGSDDVVLVEGISAWDVGPSASDWVDKNYLKIPEPDVWGLDLENKHGAAKLEKSPDGQWALLGSTEKLKKSSIDDLVRKSGMITLEEVHGKGEKPEYGFAQPSATIRLVTGTSTITGTPPKVTDTKVVKIGAKVPDQSRYFVKVNSSDYVVEVPMWAIDPLINRAPKEYVEDKEIKKDDKKPTGTDTKKAPPHVLPPQRK
jgi:hypothetical protein